MTITRKYYVVVAALGVLCLGAIVATFGAQEEPRTARVPAYPPHSPDRVGAMSIVPVIGLNGHCSHMVVTASINVIDSYPSGHKVTHEIGEVTFDLCVTDHALADKLIAAALKKWKEDHAEPSQLPTNSEPNPPPPHRRALRSHSQQ